MNTPIPVGMRWLENKIRRLRGLQPRDWHAERAAEIFSKPESEVTTEEREIGKQANYEDARRELYGTKR